MVLKMYKGIFALVSLACILLVDLPKSAGDNHVIVSKCSEDMKMEKDMMCAHTFLREMKNGTANCSHELMNFMGCIRNFTLDQCYGDYLKTHHSMMEPMRRMADMKARIHNFGRLMCGMDGNGYNVTGLPKNITDLLKCKKEFYDNGKVCAKPFHDKFKAKAKPEDLCKYFMKAKECQVDLMKKHCAPSKPHKPDPFNPFCPGEKDPSSHAGAGKLNTGVALVFVGLALHFLS